MSLVLRRIRGLIGATVAWAVAWSIVGVVVGGVLWVRGTIFIFGNPGLDWLRIGAEAGAITGALCGAVYSIAVMTVERRGDFRAITPLRFGVVGALTAGLVTGFIWSEQWLPFGLIGAAVGFLSGSGSVAVARRGLPAPRDAAGSLPPAS